MPILFFYKLNIRLNILKIIDYMKIIWPKS